MCRVKIFFSFFIVAIIFFTVHSSVYATTRYVNSDSSGAANNPTRAFNDPGYTANDSYQTFSTAYTATSEGDTIELSGGNNGKTYLGHTASITKANLTIQGSSISGYDGTVTINYQGSGEYTMGLNANGIILKNLTISRNGGLSTDYVLRIFKNTITITNVTIKNTTGNGVLVDATAVGTVFNNCYFDLDTISNYTALSTKSGITVNNSIFTGGNNPSNVNSGINLSTNSGTSTFNNIVINGTSAQAIALNGGSIANLNNCVITNPGTRTARSIYFTTNGGVINTKNCLIQGPGQAPNIITSGTGTGTWNSTNDIINGYPYFVRSKANMGFILLSTDDKNSIGYFKINADYAMNTYGIPLTIYINGTNTLTSNEKTTLQTFYKAGHEIGVHTRDHNDMLYTSPFNITYSGTGTGMAFVVSNNGTSLSVTGTADVHSPIDLTSSSYDTIGELFNLINTWPNFSAVMATGDGNGIVQSFTPSITLKNASTSLPVNVATTIPFDDTTGTSNRYYTQEITYAINDLESAIREDPACSAYIVKTMAFPYNRANNQILSWIKTNTNLTGVRSNDSVGTTAEKGYLGSINIYNAYVRPNGNDLKGSGYTSLSETQKKVRIEQAARTMATFSSNGYFTGFLTHTTVDLTAQEFQWFIDELVKYQTVDNIRINSFANLINEIRTSGKWTDMGGGIWNRTFSGSENLSPKYQSSLINGGITVTGRTTDILGNSLVGTPDIGAYEFQAPAAPTFLAQYKSDGITIIPPGGQTLETSVILKFALSSVNASDLITPQVEIQEVGQAFIGTQTNSGTAVAYSGIPAIGSVTVSGLTTGKSYHWQARGSNAASTGFWITTRQTTDFIVDFPSFTIEQLKNLLLNYLQTDDTTYSSQDNKINILDAGFVIKYLH